MICGWKACPILRFSIRATPSSRSREPRICGSDLHLYDGYIPTMEQGDILGHEFMGEVVEVGPKSRTLKRRRSRCRAFHHLPAASVSSAASNSGRCCDNTNPNAWTCWKAATG